jgi:photosystem II stability/assembly factor-like uncharacterized protein
MLRSSWSFELPRRPVSVASGLCILFAVAVALALPVGAQGQPPPISATAAWTPQGPGPATDGQAENVVPNNEVVGAIHTVLAHPTDPKILYIGAVNGGVWRTKNAQSQNPNWKPLTDAMATSSIGALERDPTDPTASTLWAGVGKFSSFGRLGGNRVGLYKSPDAGDSWTAVTGGGTLLGKNISGLAPRGNTIVISVDTADAFTFGNIGIWRSTDGGASFTQIAVGNGAATGLPGGVTFDLAGDPTDSHKLFTSVLFADLVGGLNGFYRSTDTGATWTKVSNAAIDALLISGTTNNVEFAVGRSNNVYAAVANSGRLAGLFRSGDGGTTWTAMDLPQTGPNHVGIHPGGQSSIHLSIVADPVAANVVYIGGDRQPFRAEEGLGPPQFPNSIGARNFSGRLFRCDASLAPGSQCAPLTNVGTASNSSPHADSREMTFDAAGNLIETDDGGVYRRTRPGTTTGDWFSLNGDLQVSEQHDVSYDTLANTVFAGSQDNNDPHQDSPDWFILLSGDGGDTAIETQTLASSNLSVRYDSAQGLQAFVRTFWNPANNLQGFVFPLRTVIGGGAAFVGQFTTPVELNAIQPTRLVIGGANSVYESLDQGDTIREIGPGIVINGSGVDAVAYGGLGNPDLLVVGSADRLYIRTAAYPAPLTQNLSYPATGSGRTVRDIVIDPDNGGAIYLTNTTQVYQTLDGGTTWTDVSGNIGSFAPIALRGIAYVPRSDAGGTNDALVVSTFNGIYVAYESTGFTVWSPLGTGMPNVPILDVQNDPKHGLIVAGTLGRGSWKLPLGN